MDPESNNLVQETEGADNTSKNTNVILGMILIVVFVATIIFYGKANVSGQNPDKTNQETVAAAVNNIGRIIDLPQGETPVLATVSDLAPLKGNPFYANAKVGDQVLFYTTARLAYLYDPKADMIIEIAVLNIGK